MSIFVFYFCKLLCSTDIEVKLMISRLFIYLFLCNIQKNNKITLLKLIIHFEAKKYVMGLCFKKIITRICMHCAYFCHSNKILNENQAKGLNLNEFLTHLYYIQYIIIYFLYNIYLFTGLFDYSKFSYSHGITTKVSDH